MTVISGIEVVTVGTGRGFPQLVFGEVDVNGIKLSWHRANHYRTWVEGWCPYCDEEDLQTVWVLYADCTSRGVVIDAPAAPEGADKALELARNYFKENQ